MINLWTTVQCELPRGRARDFDWTSAHEELEITTLSIMYLQDGMLEVQIFGRGVA